MDPFEELGMTEKNAEQHRRSATESQVPKNVQLLYHDRFLGILLVVNFDVYLCGPVTHFVYNSMIKKQLDNYSYPTVHKSCVWTVLKKFKLSCRPLKILEL